MMDTIVLMSCHVLGYHCTPTVSEVGNNEYIYI